MSVPLAQVGLCSILGILHVWDVIVHSVCRMTTRSKLSQTLQGGRRAEGGSFCQSWMLLRTSLRYVPYQQLLTSKSWASGLCLSLPIAYALLCKLNVRIMTAQCFAFQQAHKCALCTAAHLRLVVLCSRDLLLDILMPANTKHVS